MLLTDMVPGVGYGWASSVWQGVTPGIRVAMILLTGTLFNQEIFLS
jgi:hypothetical protein